MKIFVKTLAVAVITLGTSQAVSADGGAPGHSHAPTFTEAQATVSATAELKTLIKKEKLTADWEKASIKKVEQVGSIKDWVVQFENPEAKDATKKNLFVIMSAGGNVKAVNFTGAKKAHSHGSGPAHSH